VALFPTAAVLLAVCALLVLCACGGGGVGAHDGAPVLSALRGSASAVSDMGKCCAEGAAHCIRLPATGTIVGAAAADNGADADNGTNADNGAVAAAEGADADGLGARSRLVSSTVDVTTGRGRHLDERGRNLDERGRDLEWRGQIAGDLISPRFLTYCGNASAYDGASSMPAYPATLQRGNSAPAYGASSMQTYGGFHPVRAPSPWATYGAVGSAEGYRYGAVGSAEGYRYGAVGSAEGYGAVGPPATYVHVGGGWEAMAAHSFRHAPQVVSSTVDARIGYVRLDGGARRLALL